MANKMRVLDGSIRLIGMREAAARLDVPLSTFQRRYRDWGVPARKIGRSGQVYGAGAWPGLRRGPAVHQTYPLGCTRPPHLGGKSGSAPEIAAKNGNERPYS